VYTSARMARVRITYIICVQVRCADVVGLPEINYTGRDVHSRLESYVYNIIPLCLYFYIHIYNTYIRHTRVCLKGFDFTPETSFPYIIIIIVVVVVILLLLYTPRQTCVRVLLSLGGIYLYIYIVYIFFYELYIYYYRRVYPFIY